jgi:hypothetical protein
MMGNGLLFAKSMIDFIHFRGWAGEKSNILTFYDLSRSGQIRIIGQLCLFDRANSGLAEHISMYNRLTD